MKSHPSEPDTWLILMIAWARDGQGCFCVWVVTLTTHDCLTSRTNGLWMREIAGVCSHPTYRYADPWKGETTRVTSESKPRGFVLKRWTLTTSWGNNTHSFAVNWERNLPPVTYSPDSQWHSRDGCLPRHPLGPHAIKAQEKALALVVLTVDIKQWLPSCSA